MKFILLIFLSFGYNLLALSARTFTPLEDVFFRKSVLAQPEVCANAGCVRGKYESGRIKSYEAFYGIPYAKPPVGKLRFENPVPHGGWKGYYDASYARSDCYQKNYFVLEQPIIGSEDCLYLNVYRPNTWSSQKKLPVMVWIHAGAFLACSARPDLYGPEYLMDNGEVIVVTINFRLAIFGFLCSGDEAVKGNFGLKDQQLALEWVANNIDSFGGDSSAVTLAGFSDGAIAAHLQMLNSKSSAYFQRVILMSSSALTPLVYPIDFVAQFRLVAKVAGLKNWETASTTELAYQLRRVNGQNLVSSDALFAFTITPVMPLRPCVEGDWDGAFLTEDPLQTWATGNFAQKPILAGIVANRTVVQTIITSNETLLAEFNDDIYNLLPIQLDFNPRYVFDVLKFYFGDKEYVDEANKEKYFEMFTDRQFRYPFYTLVEQYLQYADVQNNPIFLYEFGFETPQSFSTYLGQIEYLGVNLFDNLFYLFTMTSFYPMFEPDTPESRMSEIFVRTIVNFVARGEVKVWRTHKPCTALTSNPFCDRQVFQRYSDLDPNQVIVSVTNEINQEMVKLWSTIDIGVKAVNLPPCTGGNCNC